MSRIDVHMRETDAFSWSMESDPRLRMNLVTVALLDGSPPWDEVRARFEQISRAAPMFRQRVVPSPAALSSPKWVVDARFDLDWHLRRVVAPQPASVESLLEFAAKFATEGFDPARPLWEAWLVEGLDDGRAAIVAKVHHMLTDGHGGMQLLARMFDLDGTPLTREPLPPAPPPGNPAATAVARSAVMHTVAEASGAVRGGLAGAVRTLGAARHGPRAALTGAVTTWRSVFEAVAPTGDKLSPVMTERGLTRRYATLTVPLGGLREAGRTVGGTVNDAYLTAITGGMRRYHLLHLAPVSDLRVTLPIDVRQEGDPVAGNRIALIRLLVPVLPADPAARMTEMHRRTTYWKNAPGLAYIEAAYAAVNWLPTQYLQELCRRVDFVASNVPGFPMPVHLAGPRLEGYYVFGPTGGTSVNITMMSYGDQADIGIDADSAAIPDLDAFVTCLRAGFDEVLALAPAPASRGSRTLAR